MAVWAHYEQGVWQSGQGSWHPWCRTKTLRACKGVNLTADRLISAVSRRDLLPFTELREASCSITPLSEDTLCKSSHGQLASDNLQSLSLSPDVYLNGEEKVRASFIF